MRILAFILVGLLYSCQDRYNQYFPYYYKDDVGIFKENRVLRETEKQNIKHVFSYYGVQYKEKDGEIFYKGNLSTELLLNYTIKANDSAWLSNHKK